MRNCSSRTENNQLQMKTGPASNSKQATVEWHQTVRKVWPEELLKNISVASALLVCLVMLRSGAVPQAAGMTDAVLAAAANDALLDDRLGKLSFVSALFPDAVLVFGQDTVEQIAMPVQASATVHTWSESEPYVAWTSESTCVFAAISGEVSGIYHGMDEELLIQIAGEHQTSVITGNIASVNVDVGDFVEQGELIGWIGEGSYCSFEVQDNGQSIDPGLLLEEQCSAY